MRRPLGNEDDENRAFDARDARLSWLLAYIAGAVSMLAALLLLSLIEVIGS